MNFNYYQIVLFFICILTVFYYYFRSASMATGNAFYCFSLAPGLFKIFAAFVLKIIIIDLVIVLKMEHQTIEINHINTNTSTIECKGSSNGPSHVENKVQITRKTKIHSTHTQTQTHTCVFNVRKFSVKKPISKSHSISKISSTFILLSQRSSKLFYVNVCMSSFDHI